MAQILQQVATSSWMLPVRKTSNIQHSYSHSGGSPSTTIHVPLFIVVVVGLPNQHLNMNALNQMQHSHSVLVPFSSRGQHSVRDSSHLSILRTWSDAFEPFRMLVSHLWETGEWAAAEHGRSEFVPVHIELKHSCMF